MKVRHKRGNYLHDKALPGQLHASVRGEEQRG
jgi:hypothetical protein